MNKPQKPEKEMSALRAFSYIEKVKTQVGITVGEFKRRESHLVKRELLRVADNDMALKSNIRDLLNHYDNKTFDDPGFIVLNQRIRKWCGLEVNNAN
jgi:hypothetical protein